VSEPAAADDWIAAGAIERWTAHGLECAILAGRHCLNGYVRLPAGHPALEGAEERGSVTYGPDDHGWVGMDTGHVFDWWAVDDLIGRIPEEGLEMGRTQQQFAHEYGASLPYQRWSHERLHAEVERLAGTLATYRP
jgi:hypothetical protein